MAMIDIIIPAYNAHKTINQTLASIAFQDCVDLLNIYIVNDCSEKDYSEFIDYYSNFMNIHELCLEENSGPGQARQYGIDNSSSDYILFIDSDDVLSDNFAIRRLYDGIVNSESDIAVSGFYEEKNFGFIFHDISYVWMHGKMYKRDYLKKHNIRFNKTRSNEDCGFNHLCYLCGASYINVSGISYIWQNNLGSITRENDGKTFRNNIKSFVDNMMWALDEAKKRNFDKNRFADITFGTIVSSYHYYLQNDELFKDGLLFNKLSKLINYYDDSDITDEKKVEIIKKQLFADISGPSLIKVYDPYISLREFIDILRSKKGEV